MEVRQITGDASGEAFVGEKKETERFETCE